MAIAIAKFYEAGCLKLLRREVLQSELCAQDFCKPSCGAEFALRCKFNTAPHRFLLCSTEFAPLQNDKIYGAIWRRGEICSAAHLLCGPGFAAADKI